MAKARTVYDKIRESHIVSPGDGGPELLYIDRHIVHEVTSPQAFEGLRMGNRRARRPGATLAVADHNVPTTDRGAGIKNPESALQIETLRENCHDFGIQLFDMDDIRQGICHVIGPEQGFVLPGMTLACGDSHTATQGAFGALALSIGTSELEHILATQSLIQPRCKNMRINVEGELHAGISGKDIILAIIGKIGTAGATGYVVEYAGSAIRNLSMEGRMTVCNMSVEAGARAGLVAADETTFAYLKGRPMAPKGAAWDQAVAYWKTLVSDPDAVFDAEVTLQASEIVPQVTWGTSPEDVLPIDGVVPDPEDAPDAAHREAMEQALEYMDLKPGTPLSEVAVDRVFIGSCTNSRIEDLRAAAELAKGRKVADHVQAMVVPGSGLVKRQAEEEGLDQIFLEAGFEWREPGCSMCLAMNDDYLLPGERCASTSNRNFKGRQGYGGRTHLVSPVMAVAAAVTGHLADFRELG